jgi:tetratricopeptide (TPR) repeat protein
MTTKPTLLPAALAAFAALGSLAAPAAADDPAKRKATPDKFVKAAGEAFVQAVEADKAGDLKTALGLYQKAYAISPHPSTIYNIADVQRRLLLFADALKSYETYLALAPGAADRKDVEAVIDKITKTPGTLLVSTVEASDPDAVDLKNAYVLVDGEVKIKPGTAPQPLKAWGTRIGFMIPVPGGVHVVDVVTAITHGHQACSVSVGGEGFCMVKAKPRIDGRLVINSSERNLSVRTEPKGKTIVGQRVDLPAGKHRLLVRDRSYECSPVAVTLPAGDDVQLVFLSTPDYEFERCRSIDVKQQRLTFAP